MNIDIETLIHHMHECAIGILGTHSQHCEGYPFVTVIPIALDEAHRPIILISRLAEHTKNLISDPRASVLMYAGDAKNVLAEKRVTFVGKMLPVNAAEALVARYCQYHPNALHYLSLGDFSFFRLEFEKIRFISGFGVMGWKDGNSFSEVPVLELTEEQKILEELTVEQTTNVRVLGLDFYGVDFEVNGVRKRQKYSHKPIDIPSLVENARQSLLNVL